MVEKAVVLAAGSASRMQDNIERYINDEIELKAVRKGEKMAVRFGRFPFLDYQMLNLIQSGINKVNIVLRPEDEYFINHYRGIGKKVFPEIDISFSYQKVPDGTAHAVLSARDFVDNDRFLVLNGDNNYPVESIRMAINTPENCSSLVAFDVEGFNPWVKSRLKSFAFLEIEDGELINIIEKPDNPEKFSTTSYIYTEGNKKIFIKDKNLLSMNLWCFVPKIIEACTKVKRHAPRKPGKAGEFELPDAAMLLKSWGNRIIAYYAKMDVLDLTKAEDIEIVGKQIREKLWSNVEELENRYRIAQ